MPPQSTTLNKSSKPPTNAKPDEPGNFQIDVDDALINDTHPKDTIRGGPAGKKSLGPAGKLTPP